MNGGQPVGDRDPDQDGQGDQAGQHQLRKVAGKVGIEAVQAAGGQRGELATLLATTLLAAEPAGAERQRAVDQADAQLRLHRRGRAQRGHLAAVAGGGAGQQDDGQHDQRARERRDARPGRGSGQRVGEQAGLGQDQARSGQSQGDRRDHVAARRRCVPKQPGVERPGARARLSRAHRSLRRPAS